MPQIIILAGPNGAGKTSFAEKYLLGEGLTYLNADEVARRLRAEGCPETVVDVRASRELLVSLERLIAAREDIMFETTLASLSYARKISDWRSQGYSVALIYLRLPSAEHAVARVRRRVAAGGHGIPEATIRRRFARSLDYLDRHYKTAVDEWYVWTSLEGDFRLIEDSHGP